MTRLRPAAALLVLGAALLAAGCGGGDDGDGGDEVSAPTEWADGLCSAVTAWQDELTGIGESLREGGVSQDSLQSAVDDGKSATGDFVADLRGLGRPDTEAGRQARDLVSGLGDDLEADVHAIEEAAESASTPAEVLSAVTLIGSTLQEMGAALGSTLQSLRSLEGAQELEDAFAEADACDGL